MVFRQKKAKHTHEGLKKKTKRKKKEAKINRLSLRSQRELKNYVIEELQQIPIHMDVDMQAKDDKENRWN